MLRRWLPVALAVGLAGLAGLAAPAAAAGQTSAWRYAVTGASGSAVWHYNASDGGGVDAVSFRGQVLRPAGLLRVTSTYVNRNRAGCRSLPRVRTRNYPSPGFSVQGAYVVVTWRLPLPKRSCPAAARGSVAQLLPARAFSEKVPVSRFSCPAVSLKLVGEARIPQGRTTGTLTYRLTILLRRRTAITLRV